MIETCYQPADYFNILCCTDLTVLLLQALKRGTLSKCINLSADDAVLFDCCLKLFQELLASKLGMMVLI